MTGKIHHLHSGRTPSPEPPRRARYWTPRGLRAPDAAAYIGVSQTKFRELVEAGKMPAPKRDDKVVVWDRDALDAAFDDWGGTESPSPCRNSFDD